MTLRKLFPLFGCALLLTACATNPPETAAAAPVVTLASVMVEADDALKAGQVDKAYTILHKASIAFPAEKKPWLQLAQMKFDRARYGEAINDALEVLQRDPVNRMANSIVAVSGLRLSTKAIADLTRQNELNSSLRSEARDLTKVLRSSLGDEVLPPAAKKIAVNKKLPPAVRTTAMSNSVVRVDALK